MSGYFVCDECGSRDVQRTAWVYMNTGEEVEGDGPSDVLYCENCDDNTDVSYKEETPSSLDPVSCNHPTEFLRPSRSSTDARTSWCSFCGETLTV